MRFSRSRLTLPGPVRSALGVALVSVALAAAPGAASAGDEEVLDARLVAERYQHAQRDRGTIACRFEASSWTNPADMAAKHIEGSSAATSDGVLVPLQSGRWEYDGAASLCSQSSTDGEDMDQFMLTDGRSTLVVDEAKLRAAVVPMDLPSLLFTPGAFLVTVEGRSVSDLLASAQEVVREAGLIRTTTRAGASSYVLWLSPARGYQLVRASVQGLRGVDFEVTVRHELAGGRWWPAEAHRVATGLIGDQRSALGRNRVVMSGWSRSSAPTRLAIPAGFAIVDTVAETSLPIGASFEQLAGLHARILSWSTGPAAEMRYATRPWREDGWPAQPFSAGTLNSQLLVMKRAGDEMRSQYLGEGLCGELAVLTLLSFHGIERSLEEVRASCSPDRGMSLEEMRAALRGAGLTAEWVNLEVDDAFSLTEPFVMLPRPKPEAEDHFVVCRNAPGGTVVVTDFPFPPKRLDASWLRRHWQGAVLVLGADARRAVKTSWWPWWKIGAAVALGLGMAGLVLRRRRARRAA